MRAALKAIVGGLGYEIRRREPEKLGYLDTARTVADARAAGLTVNQHLGRLWGSEGLPARVVDQIAGFGVFDRSPLRVLEIGPGTGSHLEAIAERFSPESYEIYEVHSGWRKWLADTHPITAHEADGRTLRQTPDASVDVALSIATFVYLPFLVTRGYWEECCRVVRPGGHVAFDGFTEACLTDELVDAWKRDGSTYPVPVPKAYAVGFFAERGFTLAGSFLKRYADAKSECLVFRKG